MRISSCLLSLLLHVGILFLGLYFPWQGASKPVDLGSPVYEVNLVRAPEPEPEEPVEVSAQEEAKQPAEKEPSGQEPDRPQAAKRKSQASKSSSQPKAVQLQKDSQSESKPAPEPKQKKQQPAKKKKQAEQKKKAQSQPTQEELLDQALGEIRQNAKSQEERNQEYLAQELAGLRTQAQEGSSRRGGDSGSSRLEEIYGLQVQTRIQENWRYPSLGAEADLAAEVEIQINEQGEITGVNLRNSSGRRDFDSSVLRAVEDTEMLPSPPREDLRKIRITFHAQDLEG
ncbi:MAG: energy transducer TonB [Thermodesulfobacteriota bacterium]